MCIRDSYNPVKVIRHAIETANTEIIEQAQKDEKLRGMGTTMVVATIVGQYACLLYTSALKQRVFPNSKRKEITQRWHLEQSEQREIPF